MAGWGGPGRGGGDRGELHHSRLVSPKSRRRAFAQPGTQPRHGARAGRGGGRHSGRAILTGPAAPGSGARSGARRKHSRRASSLGRASHGRRQRALGVGAEPLPRVSGGWGLAASGVVVAGGGGRQLRRQLKGLWRRAGKDGGDRRGTPETVPPVPSSGSQGPGGRGPSRARPVLWTRWQRRRGETVLGDRLAAGAREGRGWRAQGVCP